MLDGDHLQDGQVPEGLEDCSKQDQDQLQCQDCDHESGGQLKGTERLVHPQWNCQHLLNERARKRITYDSWQGYYIVHTSRGEVRFYKDEHGLPYINLEGLSQEATTMLMQIGVKGVHFESGGEVRLASGSETQAGRMQV